jgi:hypothetical protein
MHRVAGALFALAATFLLGFLLIEGERPRGFAVPILSVALVGSGLVWITTSELAQRWAFWRKPNFELEPRVNLIMQQLDGEPVYDSQAVVLVRNASDRGGTRDVAKGVTPEVEIFDSTGGLIVNYVGWDNCAQRDFRPTREEHALYVAFRGHSDQWMYATLPTASERHLLGWGSNFRVRVTLRGDSWMGAIAHDFLLTRVKQGGLRLERADSK